MVDDDDQLDDCDERLQELCVNTERLTNEIRDHFAAVVARLDRVTARLDRMTKILEAL